MAKILTKVNGKLQDQNGEEFKGQASRDLDVGDKFPHEETGKTLTVKQKYTTPEGLLVVSCVTE